jgi:hypothetical protein
MKKKLKIALAILAAFIVLILILAALVITAPQSCPYTVAEAEADSLLAAEIADMISDAIVDEEGNIPEIAVVTIPAENVNALLRVAAYRLNRELKDEGIECSLGWENSAIKAVACIPLPLSKAVIVRGTASPVIADGKLNAPAKGMKAGHLPLFVNVVKKDITAADIENEKLKLAFEAVHSLSATPDGGLKIGIYPAKISNLTRVLIMDEETKSPQK